MKNVLVAAVTDAFASRDPRHGDERWAKHSAEPWLAWLLASLVRQVERQRWLSRFIEEHDAQLEEMKPRITPLREKLLSLDTITRTPRSP